MVAVDRAGRYVVPTHHKGEMDRLMKNVVTTTGEPPVHNDASAN